MAEESIYALIPSPEALRQKPPRHTSKHRGDLPPTGSTFGAAATSAVPVTNVGGEVVPPPRAHAHRQPHAHFGPKDLHYSNPKEFLKKHSQPPLPSPKKHTYKSRTSLSTSGALSMTGASIAGTSATAGESVAGAAAANGQSAAAPDIPAVSGAAAAAAAAGTGPASASSPTKNFVRANVLNAMTMSKRTPADTRVVYRQKPDYGRVPDYLQDVKREVETEKQIIASVVAARREAAAAAQPQMRLMNDAERDELLTALKGKWEFINNQYQTMTHNVLMDTQGKVRRKEEYEQQLHQLEKSIEKLSKKHVYVHDDQPGAAPMASSQ